MRIILAALLLAGCAHHEVPPTPLIPVASQCVKGQVPAEPRHVDSELTGDSGVDIGIIAGSAIELRAWGQALFGIVEACRSKPSAP